MRLAILSDIHGNMAALDAVIADVNRQQPDLVVHGGDLALMGPRPGEVVDRIRELGWPGILGNTDEALWYWPNAYESMRSAFEPRLAATLAMLGDERVRWLQALPEEWRQEAAVALVHAVPGDTWKRVPPNASDEELTEVFGSLRSAIAVYCHIHVPYVRRLSEFYIANAGSVGLPVDGDWRASYLLIQDGEPVIRRVEYDLERELSDLRSCGYPGADEIAAIQKTGQSVVAPTT